MDIEIEHCACNPVSYTHLDVYKRQLTDYAEFHYIFQFGDNVIDYRYRKLDNQSLIYEKLVLDGSLLYEFDYRKHKGIMDGITKLAPTPVSYTHLLPVSLNTARKKE